MPVVDTYVKRQLPTFLKQEERDLIDTAIRVGWQLHVSGGTAVTLIGPDPYAHKKIHLGRRSSVPIKRMRIEVAKFANPDLLAQMTAPTPKGTTTTTTGATTMAAPRRTAAARAVRAVPDAGSAAVPGTHIVSTWEQVSPEGAQQLLDANTNNRNISTPLVERITHDMTEGRYRITHQGVAVSEDGVLLDGQHRLLAIIASGTTQTLLVTRGLPAIAQTSMDGGRKRAAADFLDGGQAAMRASAARLIIAFHQASPRVSAVGLSQALRSITTTEVLESLSSEQAAALELLAPETQRAYRNIPIMGPSPLLAATVLLIPDLSAASEYLNGYITLTGMPAGDPRAALMKVRGESARRMPQHIAFGYALRATQAYVDGKSMRMLRSLPANTTFMDLNPIEEEQE